MEAMKQQLIFFVLGEVAKALRGEIFKPQAAKSGPHYFEESIPSQVLLGSERHTVAGREVTFALKGYLPDILLIEAQLEVADIFSEETFELEEQTKKRAYEILKKKGGSEEFSENYSVFTVSQYQGDADRFLAQHQERVAALLKSERLELDPKEIEYTLNSQIKYAKNDLTIVDWDGAFIFDPEGDVDATIELLALANLQLLRHRILDRKLDERLEETAKLVKMPPKKMKFLSREKDLAEDLGRIIRYRTDSLKQLQTIERDVKLIGEWFSARLYDLTAKKFKIQEWRNAIKDKLDSLEDIYSIIAENFSISAQSKAEWVQIIAFFILQVGWFTLIILEFFYFTR